MLKYHKARLVEDYITGKMLKNCRLNLDVHFKNISIRDIIKVTKHPYLRTNIHVHSLCVFKQSPARKENGYRSIVQFQGGSHMLHLTSRYPLKDEHTRDEQASNVNVTTLGVPLASQGVVPSYGSTTPYQIHLYKRGTVPRQGSTSPLIILATICSTAIAEPGYVRSVIPYSYLEVLDTPEVAQAKAAHLATQAYEAARNTLGYAHVPALIHVYTPVSGAPLGADGNVIDTPEVAEAKAAHLTAHALETAKNLGLHPYGALAFASLPYAYRFGYGAPIGPDGRVIDTPEVAAAKAAHLAAHEAAKLANDH
ncbi:hypothetical protein APICC_00995 [Apis cerana cerana]|uniref:Cuticle protein n=1 Tax=Apis cerana cerana TaxID=94128 RepID=A0A2A3E7F2_APICC|nr:hypothetical protein APICC_00995 [Apis cerana cerana]